MGPGSCPWGELCPTGDLVFQASWGVATSFLASLSPVHLPHEAAVACGYLYAELTLGSDSYPAGNSNTVMGTSVDFSIEDGDMLSPAASS